MPTVDLADLETNYTSHPRQVSEPDALAGAEYARMAGIIPRCSLYPDVLR